MTPEQRRQYDEDGFTLVEQVFSAAEMDRIDAAFERLHDVAAELAQQVPDGGSVTHGGANFTFGPRGVVRHIAMCGNVEPDLLHFGRDQRLLRIAAALLGIRDMRQLINQAHYKRPGSGVTFDWHQDAQHRGNRAGRFRDLDGRGSYVQTALAIDDVTPDAGPLMLVRASHRRGQLDAPLTDHFTDADVATHLPRRGDLLCFGPYTIHGSTANQSSHPRRIFINGFALPDAPQTTFSLPRVGDLLTAS